MTIRILDSDVWGSGKPLKTSGNGPCQSLVNEATLGLRQAQLVASVGTWPGRQGYMCAGSPGRSEAV